MSDEERRQVRPQSMTRRYRQGLILVGVLCVLATLAAALLTWRLRNLRVKGVPVLASLPPVVINAVVVGLELTLVSPVFTPQVLAINMLSVGIGQLLACTVCGLLLHAALERSGAAAHLFGRRARI